ncbi:MAG TPA: response regulator [Thermoguttaceae bacterium]|nr:response regulator [Thermoguttaceae bacterium]
MYAEVMEKPKAQTLVEEERQSILIVDDDDTLTDVLSRRLQQQGFATMTANSGRSGLGIAQSVRPALIVLDLRLPDSDGFAVCKQLADSPETCDIPVIILSGLEQPGILRRCRAAGCCYFLRKPYDPNAMLILIRQAIREASAWDEPKL